MTSAAKKVLIIVGAVVGLFTLCVVLGFMLIVVPALGGARRMARRTVCAANEKLLANAIALRAAANADSIVPPPSPVFGGSWMCDQPLGFTDPVVAAMAGTASDPRKIFYCPANTDQSAASMWAVAPYRVTGYVWTNDRSEEPGAVLPALAAPPARGFPELMYHRKFASAFDAEKAELALDWIISTTNTPATAAWTGITSPGRPGTYDSSHMRGGNPVGANVLAFDGHVEWRNFVPANATPLPQGAGGTGPYFWVPNP